VSDETDDDIQAAADQIAAWRDDIVLFVRDSFGVEPDPWQLKALKLFASDNPKHQRIALQACVGPGKTAVLAWCAWWFLATQGDEENHPKGLATAITGDNLKGNLWSELAHWQGKSPYLMQEFTWTSTAVFCNEHPATWRLEARSWPKTASPEQQGQTFSGLHAKYVLVLVDESGNIPPAILRAAEQALSTCVYGKIMQAGNPTSREGMLYAAAYPLRHQWVIVVITGDPDDPEAWVHSPRVGERPKLWAQEQIDTYGRDNAWVKSQILGQFPPSSINALFDTEDLEKAVRLQYKPEVYQHIQKRIGVDVARFGDDRSVIAPRQGLMAFAMKVMRNARTTDIAARVQRVWQRWGGEALVIIDDTGHWGHGVVDQLTVASVPHLPLVYHAKANHPRYKNRRAEMYDAFAKWVKRGGALPNDPELIGELAALTYTLNNGQLQIIEKDQLKETLGRSPDKADALAQTFCMEDQPAELPGGGGQSSRARTHDDPQGRDTHRQRAGRAVVADDLED
jgi:phage terminase large subunit